MQIANFALRLLIVGALIPTGAEAASFDCTKSTTNSEIAICESSQLSKLDREMASLYGAAAQFTVSGDTTTLHDQRDWLRVVRQACDKDPDISACLTDRYVARIAELKTLPREARTRLAGASAYTPSDASGSLTFTIRLRDACSDITCEAPGQISVMRTGTAGGPHMIDLPTIVLTRRGDGSVLTNSSNRYDYQGTINTGDFNFDGAADFAVQTGNNGSYGGPSYDVFLQDRPSGRFLYAPALSALTLSGLGFFEVDESARELVEYTKDGCCYHEETHYSVHRSMPIPTWRHVEDATGDHLSSFTEIYANGQWTRAKGKRP